ncbi:MAG: preprotein translocase subunit SecE [Planctomycetes bacterium]|nr:preprotein translocase subunit SecE [Planctomycetota bacterium]
MTSRIGILALIVLFGMYAGYSWFGHFGGQPGTIGAVVLLGFFTILSIYISLINNRSTDFLIELDAELRKVMWPATSPLFDPKAEAWGATFVVIVTVIVFALFIYLSDKGLTFFLQHPKYGLFEVLFGKG